jgi:hypothetical protein
MFRILGRHLFELKTLTTLASSSLKSAETPDQQNQQARVGDHADLTIHIK